MGSIISNYIVIVAISGVLSVLLALFAYYKKTDFLGIRAFVISSFTSAIYTFGFALELSGKTLEELSFWIKLEYLGMPFIAPASLIMVIHFVGLETLFKKAYGRRYLSFHSLQRCWSGPMITIISSINPFIYGKIRPPHSLML